MIEEITLLNKLRNGDHKAQRELYEQYHDKMIKKCKRVLRNVEDAEDAVMQAFDSFFRGINRVEIRGPGAIRAYLRGCLRRATADVIRCRQRLKLTWREELPEIPHEPDAFCALHREDISLLIDRILPESQRLVICMAYEGYTHEEVWKQFGIPEASSRALLSKARMRVLTSMLAQGIFPYCID
jgi:RNA polymerase sigma-70 factor (ECF subfamily)